MTAPLLDVRGLQVAFGTRAVLRRLNLQVQRGGTTALVGESGSGKSVTALAILGLLPPEACAKGAVLLEGEDLMAASASRMRSIRGSGIAMIFQEPMTSLNPVFTIGEQVSETIRAHSRVSRRAASQHACDALEEVGIDGGRAGSWPHEFSGGMRQRVMIAMALACGPRVLIADEPTTALDVTTAASIIDLLRDLQRRHSMGLLFITHDLPLAASVADDALVLRDGRVVEQGAAADVFGKPRDPYTAALIDCVPSLDRRVDRLPTVEDVVNASS